MNTTAPRPYRMTARAESVQATADRILDAAADVFWERPTTRLSLDEVATRAGVTKQTVLRRFGTRAGLVAAAAEREIARVEAERGDVAPGDVGGAVRAVVAHYERLGDGVLRMLAEEPHEAAVGEHAAVGREYHARWCEHAFAPALAGLRGRARERRLAQLVAVTDVQVWKLLRRDRGLARGETELAMRELVEALVGDAG